LTRAFDGIGIDLGRVGFEQLRASQFAHRVLVVIKDHNVHGSIVPSKVRSPVGLDLGWARYGHAMNQAASAVV
jgi:hypothetical protein